MAWVKTAFEIGIGWFGAQIIMGLCFILLVGVCICIGEVITRLRHKFKN